MGPSHWTGNDSHDDGWAMHPPFSFRSCRKENGPCTVQKKRPLGRAPVQWPSALTGVGVPVPAPILPSLRARLGLLRFPQLPTRGGWCGGRRGARSHLTSFSFRAFRFATRCPGGCRGRCPHRPAAEAFINHRPAAAKREATQCDDHPDEVGTIRHGTAVSISQKRIACRSARPNRSRHRYADPRRARRATAPERA